MKAFNSDAKLKDRLAAQLAQHREAHELVQHKTAWDGRRGDVIGCLTHQAEYGASETILGVPAGIAHIAGAIFSGEEETHAQDWAQAFVGSIKPGADLSSVMWAFIAWLLTDETQGVVRFVKSPSGLPDYVGKVADAIQPQTKDAPAIDFEALTGEAWGMRRDAIRTGDPTAHFAMGMVYAAAMAATHANAHSPDWPYRLSEIVNSCAGAAPDTTEPAARQTRFKAHGDKLIALIQAA